MTEPAPPGRPPDLLFCRRCGASVARRDVLSGRARLLEDRAYCAACAPGALAFRRSVRAAVAAAASSLLVLALLASLDARRRASTAESTAGAASAALAAVEERAGRDAARVEALDAGARGVVEAAARLAEGLRSLREEAAGGREVVEDRLEGVERSLSTVLDALEGLRREVGALRGNPRLTEAEEAEQLARLEDANAGARFEALWILQRGGGRDARKAAVKGLADPEDSVRWQAAVLARVLAVKEAAPGLVDCLTYPSAAVRSAAIEALVALEGEDLGYDPLDPSERSRSEAVQRWVERLRSR